MSQLNTGTNMKLFIDDIREPWKGWHVARTITEAIRILATVPVDQVSLDYDIRRCSSGKHLPAETFEPVARYLALLPEKERPTILFHTANPEGGRRMANILGVKYVPTFYDDLL